MQRLWMLTYRSAVAVPLRHDAMIAERREPNPYLPGERIVAALVQMSHPEVVAIRGQLIWAERVRHATYNPVTGFGRFEMAGGSVFVFDAAPWRQENK